MNDDLTESAPGETVDQSTADAPPRPTYAPAAMAMGIMMLLWGIVTMWIMSVGGAALMIWSLWTWINEIRKA